MKEFKEVLNTPRYNSAYWQNRLAQFYLKHKDYKNASIFFNNGLSKFPNSTLVQAMHKGLQKANEKR